MEIQFKHKYSFPHHRIQIVILVVAIIYQLGSLFYQVYLHIGQPDMLKKQSFLTSFLEKQRYFWQLQWETFRNNLPFLFVAIIAGKIISKFIQNQPNSKAWILGTILLSYSFRSDIFLYLGLSFIWYIYSKLFYKFRFFIPLSWILVLVLLLYNQMSRHFGDLTSQFGKYMPFQFMDSAFRKISCGQVMNLTILRWLSFSLDLSRGDQSYELQNHMKKCSQCVHPQNYCLKGRDYLNPNNYSIKNYFNYILFAPTFLAGPPIGYKNFISFQTLPSPKRPLFIRWILNFIIFEIIQHVFPIIPLQQGQSAYIAYGQALVALSFMWFKFLIIWRIHKQWALLHQVQVVDNMNRCIFNNYGFQGFWRSWHRGFNQWILRYLYIPLGGRKRILPIVASIFFVAFWHDHTMSIIIWALAVSVLLIVEASIKGIFKSKCQWWFNSYICKYITAFAASFSVVVLISANLAGFAGGSSQFMLYWKLMANEWVQFLRVLILTSNGVVLMYYIRTLEKNRVNY